ncbi:MAG: aminomethyl-transferring glycine dehydrogenase [Gammaproteobacteria bacterium]|jgi:glycine dehydrogenase|nr:aminomethyl-transferring glycine dehydrogenase [Gammaproteobacteria bacterium]
MFKNWQNKDEFIGRHIGSTAAETDAMLMALEVQSIHHLVAAIIPENILSKTPLNLPNAVTEEYALNELKSMMSANQVKKSALGLGYYETLTPSVILRNVMQNPGWYTTYTPYQAEISQGRLEVLLNFQQMIMDLTGFDLANASLLDEATAAAEAMAMAKRITGCERKQFFVDASLFPQTIEVLKTRAQYFGFELIIDHFSKIDQYDVFGVMTHYAHLSPALKKEGRVLICACDLLHLVLFQSPASLGADIAFGSSQRFGIPMGFGGPHAAFFATKEAYKRTVPGRIIGVSKDARGKLALRMALQTREQHIRREKANSNICTSQVLLANMAALYAMYHGSQGLKNIAHRVHYLANLFKTALVAAGVNVLHDRLFDTVAVSDVTLTPAQCGEFNLRFSKDGVRVNFSETTTPEDVVKLLQIFTGKLSDFASLQAVYPEKTYLEQYAAHFRQDNILAHPNFNHYHTETKMMRYLKKLENRDLSLTGSMIPLGSCTMKLNAASELMPLNWASVSAMHPFAPDEQTQGYQALFASLTQQLKAMTGFDDVSLQPNSGAQGEYAGLLAIRRYQAAQNQSSRTVCLIPKSAHGTNPATAQMMGLTVVIVDCDERGNVNVDDLRAKAQQHQDQLSCLMITYPSTHGVFETAIKDITQIIHDCGGQVYMDGANFNALVGYVKPAELGADVMHMNLHKTFAIPHGGGGPGMGPIGLRAHLVPYAGTVSAAPFGSASILTISWMYIRMMGGNGLRQATEYALLNANYIAAQLKPYYPILYTGKNGFVAHECIIDLRPLKAETGITEVDIAKRLMDYGFHAPTMSFPVPGTLMVEPTESESKTELDRFIDAMIAIFNEVQKVKVGEWGKLNNPLKQAPHTEEDVRHWDRPYSIEIGCYPSAHTKCQKYWPSVNRIDDVFGDRMLVCSCPSVRAP